MDFRNKSALLQLWKEAENDNVVNTDLANRVLKIMKKNLWVYTALEFFENMKRKGIKPNSTILIFSFSLTHQTPNQTHNTSF
jgi:pentatricopeptide repeat protein